jgi:hypothetical protein
MPIHFVLLITLCFSVAAQAAQVETECVSISTEREKIDSASVKGTNAGSATVRK